jgi:alkanesulfonate monooxygenase SsuD/methylene tetrahydromethanopterin reductase-like flavin-dependent oxidoreductase (luciferase family)
MKLGIQLHPERGVDAVMEEARRADEQGFDSIWLSDHMMNPFGEQRADGPLDYFVLMTALAAVTKRSRLAWGMLNVSFRAPAVFAKMIASLDQISHGRVICTLGSGWMKEEYEAYGIHWIDDHDARVAHGREVVQLLKALWTRPAPERVSFAGEHVKVRDIQFNPAPYQKPHPPIWIGGDSEATLATVKKYGDGWVMIRSGTPQTLAKARSAPDWPKRPLTLVKQGRVITGETRAEALREAEREYEAISGSRFAPATFDEFVKNEVIGTADECLSRLAEIESWGINYLRLAFSGESAQAGVARLILPRL